MIEIPGSNKGQSLIEVIVALVIVGLIALGIVKATTVAVKNGNFAKSQGEAITAAQNHLTEVKRLMLLADNTYWGTTPLGFPAGTSEYTLIQDYFCLRTVIAINADYSNLADLSVTVSWEDKSSSTQCRAGSDNYIYQQIITTHVAKPS